MSDLSPTTRSRTLLFISYRDSRSTTTRFSRPRLDTSANAYGDAYAPDDERQGLISPKAASGHVAIEINLPPKWVDLSDQVEEILTATQSKISALEKLHAKHVLPGFADRTAEEKEIEVATLQITKDFRRCQSLIQQIGSVHAHTFPPSSHARHEAALTAQNVQRGLAAKLQELSASFRKKQRVYMEKLQGHAIRNQDLLVASGAVSLRGSEGMSAVDEDIEAAKQSQDQTQTLEQRPNLRDRELTEIARSIADLAELFKDLSVLVIDQGTLLDSIEYNIEQTAVYVDDAAKELTVATRYQKNTGRRKCIFLLLLIIFGLVLVIIFKPRRPSVESPPSEPPISHART